VGIDGGGGGAGGEPGYPACEGEQDPFGEELDADMAFGGAEGSAQTDLGAALEDGDDHGYRAVRYDIPRVCASPIVARARAAA